jgi:16S rRNA (guanine(966)-N(2))-methyltransferase RsmD
MSLKVIGGEYGGRVLRTARGLGTRPLLGQVREALFNILTDEVPGAFVWDLFAGSGASGIESLSRGAARVLFCEKNGRALDILRQNLETLGGDAAARSVVMRADAWDPPVMHRGAFGASREDQDGDAATDAEVAPDIVFLDPPYSMVAEDLVKSMARARHLQGPPAARVRAARHVRRWPARDRRVGSRLRASEALKGGSRVRKVPRFESSGSRY